MLFQCVIWMTGDGACHLLWINTKFVKFRYGIATWMGFLWSMVRWKFGSIWGVVKWKHCLGTWWQVCFFGLLHDSWRVHVWVLVGWVHLTQVHSIWCMMTSEDGSNGLRNGFCWTDGLWKVGIFFNRSWIPCNGSLAKYVQLLWYCLFVDQSCLKIFIMQKVHFQLFCFSTDFNFDYRFLEGMTGGIFEM